MKTNEKKVPVMASGPSAYWVGEGERIKTSSATWIYPKLIAKKLAVIIPVTKEKLEDTTIDVFSELRPSISEAFYKTVSLGKFSYSADTYGNKDNGSYDLCPLAQGYLAPTGLLYRGAAVL